MSNYYAQKLSDVRLRQCYDIAPPRVQQYLQAEIEFTRHRISPTDTVLELGCGYGRVLEQLADSSHQFIGVDISYSSLHLGRQILKPFHQVHLVQMDARDLAFLDDIFDVVLCIQNGLSAFGVDREQLVEECMRVSRPGGKVLFSTYSVDFWQDRLEWFRLQSELNLLGEIDWENTKDGEIVCKDGFTATTISVDEFKSLTGHLGRPIHIEEVDGSSLFCEIDT